MDFSLTNDYQAITNNNFLTMRTKLLNKDIEKASSGKRINSASDDAAGVSVSDGLMNQVRGRKAASMAIQNGLSILSTAEGSLNISAEHIQRMRELTVQAASDEYTTEERQAILEEINVRVKDLDRVALSTKFNKVNLLDGSASQFRLQVGIDSDLTENTVQIGTVLTDARATALGISAALNFTAAAGGIFENGTSARDFLNTLDYALEQVNERRSQIAAYQNRLNSTYESNIKSIETYTKSYSSIRDADIASVTADMTKQKILRESTVSVMMQSNSNSSVALNLLASA